MKAMKSFLVFILAVGCILFPVLTAHAGKIISGAGATFPYPLYSKWAYIYAKKTGIRLNYQSIGSGGGIRQIKAKTVDFGASDAPMDPGELKEYGLFQFPMVIGGVVPVINLKGVASNTLRLDGETLADMFLGKIHYWNDARIKRLNPGLSLPSTSITVVHRSDGSGTTWIFSHYLAAKSHEWQKRVGAGKALDWPAGLGGKGNEGVAAYVKRIKGAIGYVELAYAKQNRLTTILLKDKYGRFVAPTMKTFQAASEGADWEGVPGMAVVLVDQPGEDSWPITGASFIIMYKNQTDRNRVLTILNFFDWCLRHGQSVANELFYVPLPVKVVDIVEREWAKEIRVNGKPVWNR